MPAENGSVTPSTAAVATAASTALPPLSQHLQAGRGRLRIHARHRAAVPDGGRHLLVLNLRGAGGAAGSAWAGLVTGARKAAVSAERGEADEQTARSSSG